MVALAQMALKLVGQEGRVSMSQGSKQRPSQEGIAGRQVARLEPVLLGRTTNLGEQQQASGAVVAGQGGMAAMAAMVLLAVAVAVRLGLRQLICREGLGELAPLSFLIKRIALIS